MGLFDKLVRTVQRNVERNVERKVEQEVASAVNKQFSKGVAGPNACQYPGGTEGCPPDEQADSGKYRLSKRFSPPQIPGGKALRLYAPTLRAESRAIADRCFDLAQKTAVDSERRDSYNMAAAHGHIGAMFMQGMIHYGDLENFNRREGKAESFKGMVVSFEDAALYNHVPSMEMLGYIYAGIGDFDHAKNWLEKAAALDSAYANELLQNIP